MHEDSVVGCVCMVWPYPEWRADVQFSLRPGCQLASLVLNVGLRSLHGSIMGCDLGRGEMRQRRESCEFFPCSVVS